MPVIAKLAVVVAAVAAVPSNPQRIVGGTETTIDNYPSAIVLLITINWSYYWQNYGGSIINSRGILTAAHCIIDDTAERWRIRAGSTYASSGGTTHDTQSILIHPEYNSRTADNDVAILRLTNEIVFSNNAQAGFFAGSNYNLADNQVVWAAGWGRIYSGGPLSEELRHVQIWTVNQAECRRRYATVGNTVTDNMLCSGYLDVGGRDQCQGDSGGPLYHNGVVVGVSSWGRGCADAFFPGVNARVSRYITWIQANA